MKDKTQFLFTIDAGAKRVYILKAASVKDMKEWIDALRITIRAGGNIETLEKNDESVSAAAERSGGENVSGNGVADLEPAVSSVAEGRKSGSSATLHENARESKREGGDGTTRAGDRQSYLAPESAQRRRESSRESSVNRGEGERLSSAVEMAARMSGGRTPVENRRATVQMGTSAEKGRGVGGDDRRKSKENADRRKTVSIPSSPSAAGQQQQQQQRRASLTAVPAAEGSGGENGAELGVAAGAAGVAGAGVAGAGEPNVVKQGRLKKKGQVNPTFKERVFRLLDNGQLDYYDEKMVKKGGIDLQRRTLMRGAGLDFRLKAQVIHIPFYRCYPVGL